MRGGSSKGAYFLAGDLPTDIDARDELLRRIMGSPDVRQIDGIGGAHPLTSKVAIVAASDDDSVDLNYLFLQVGVDDDIVSDRQNCGNLLAGVGPFALERGLVSVEPSTNEASVRIRMLNTDSVAVASFAVEATKPVYEGDTSISGVPGHAAAIVLEFEDIAGATTGELLPTGNVVDQIDGTSCTLVDNGMPVVVVRADAVGVSGHEACHELEANKVLRTKVERLRLAAGPLMNLGDVAATTIPKVTLVSPARSGGDLATRTFIPHRCHDAIGVLGAVSVATACLLDGSPANDLAVQTSPERVRLEHPTGFFDALVSMGSNSDGLSFVDRAGIVRTARKLMDGVVFPRPDPRAH